jgi:prepilin-type processing-associated H-X9-DG protein
MRNAKRTSYFFSAGHYNDTNSPYDNMLNRRLRNLGAFGSEGAARFDYISDGTSNVIAIGESHGGSENKVDPLYGPWGLTGTGTCCMGRFLNAAGNTALVGTPITYSATDVRDYQINAAYQNDPQGRSGPYGYRSQHPGGAQFLLCDGSAHFLSETTEYLTLLRLAFIADGEVVGQF